MANSSDLLDAATAQTGLADFGDNSFREGLEILVAALRDEARLNAAGDTFIHHRIVGYLAQRLQVEDWYRRHPDIDDVPIDAPLIGLGLPRTGSTALSLLLAQDPDARYLGGGSLRSRARRRRPCTVSIRASLPATARWSAPAVMFPVTSMGRWSVTS